MTHEQLIAKLLLTGFILDKENTDCYDLHVGCTLVGWVQIFDDGCVYVRDSILQTLTVVSGAPQQANEEALKLLEKHSG